MFCCGRVQINVDLLKDRVLPWRFWSRERWFSTGSIYFLFIIFMASTSQDQFAFRENNLPMNHGNRPNCSHKLNNSRSLKIDKSSFVPQGSFGQAACGLRLLFRKVLCRYPGPKLRPIADWLVQLAKTQPRNDLTTALIIRLALFCPPFLLFCPKPCTPLTIAMYLTSSFAASPLIA
jgi:hypothetical protein